MSRELHEKLARVEILLDKGNLSFSEFRQKKWSLLLELYQRKQVVKPVFKDKRKRMINDPLGNEFNYIPSGPFLFGEEIECSELKAGIYMAKHPVTVKDFISFLKKSGWEYSDEDRKKMDLVSPDPHCPVSHVSWLDAKEYCRWLRKETNHYYSLPSEIEWEIAARGVDGRPYPWGYEALDENRACFQGKTAYDGTVPVGKFIENKSPFNCMDMVGNVWEWCVDSFDDPRDPHILRGGSWCNSAEFSTCMSRTFSHPPEKRIDYGGFRVLYLPEDLWEEYRDKCQQTEEEIDRPSLPKKKSKASQASRSKRSPAKKDTKKTGKPTPKPAKEKEEENILEFVGSHLPKEKPSKKPSKKRRKQSSKSGNHDVLEFMGMGSADFKKPSSKLKVDEKQANSISEDSRVLVRRPKQHKQVKREVAKPKKKGKNPGSSSSSIEKNLQQGVDSILDRHVDNLTIKDKPIPKSALYIAYGVWGVLLITVLVLWVLKLTDL